MVEGSINWREVAQDVTTRSPGSLRQRYKIYHKRGRGGRPQKKFKRLDLWKMMKEVVQYIERRNIRDFIDIPWTKIKTKYKLSLPTCAIRQKFEKFFALHSTVGDPFRSRLNEVKLHRNLQKISDDT